MTWYICRLRNLAKLMVWPVLVHTTAHSCTLHVSYLLAMKCTKNWLEGHETVLIMTQTYAAAEMSSAAVQQRVTVVFGPTCMLSMMQSLIT